MLVFCEMGQGNILYVGSEKVVGALWTGEIESFVLTAVGGYWRACWCLDQ